MKYTSCFIGIPLPTKFLKQYRAVATEISKIMPGIHLAELDSPHITIYYLDEQSQNNLADIKTKTTKHLNSLKGSKITVGNMGLFSNPDRIVLFLDVKYDNSLNIFHNKITKELVDYNAYDNSLKFSPHMTIGKISKNNEVDFSKEKEAIKRIIDGVDWTFEVNEIIMYGVDSRIQPESREILSFLKV
ncbi:MAG: RNA 2',3'-cyclic phosphodiesterase [bacterium]